MRKLGLILAGAALFDLGTIVATSHAAISLNFTKIKIDYKYTAASCVMDGGVVVVVGRDKFCQPKAPAKKDEARKK